VRWGQRTIAQIDEVTLPCLPLRATRVNLLVSDFDAPPVNPSDPLSRPLNLEYQLERGGAMFIGGLLPKVN
jgi:hypothetical protein